MGQNRRLAFTLQQACRIYASDRRLPTGCFLQITILSHLYACTIFANALPSVRRFWAYNLKIVLLKVVDECLWDCIILRAVIDMVLSATRFPWVVDNRQTFLPQGRQQMTHQAQRAARCPGSRSYHLHRTILTSIPKTYDTSLVQFVGRATII